METMQTSQDETPTLRWHWIQEQVALTREELEAGDGCHPDEAKVLGDYLENDWNAQKAAEKFTSPVLQEQDPFATLYRPWGLLSTALVELPADRQKLVELLLAIQSMLPLQKVDWSQLVGWAAMWSDLYRLHFHGSADWEHWPTEEKAKLYGDFTNRGAAEAEMFLRGIGGIPIRWGYEAVSLVASRRSGLDCFIFQVHAWLKVAGSRLKAELNSEKPTFLGGFRYDTRGRYAASPYQTLIEHWNEWQQFLSELRSERSSLPFDGRKVAAECLTMME